jgi:long-chain acyl-CoA synthetase
MASEKPWLQAYPPELPTELDIEPVTMPQSLTRISSRIPDNDALFFMGKKIKYGELEQLVNRFARALLDLKVKKGDRVAVILPNIPQVVVANYAVMKIGAVVVLNNPLNTERELEYQLSDSGATVLVTLDLMLPKVLNVIDKTSIRTIVNCHINDYLGTPLKQLFPLLKKEMYRKAEPREGLYEFLDLVNKYPGEPLEDQSVWEDLAALLYTGGTTGVSKGVMLTHSNICSSIQMTKAFALPETQPGEKVLGIFPFFHVAGFTQIQGFSLWHGLTLALIPRPMPEAIVSAIKKFKPNYLPGVPTIWVALLNNEVFCKMDLSFVKGYISGAAPLSLDTINKLQKLSNVDIITGLGLTETAGLVTCTPWGGKLVKPGTIGLPMPNTEVKIVDVETGTKDLKQGEIGEILIKGPSVMRGYYNRPEETEIALKDGWVYTGDIGYFDEDNYLFIVDRKKDLIISGGYNVYPLEVDEILFQHPKILEACVIGVPDEYRGEKVKAFVVVKPGETLTEEEVIQYCKDKLAAYKVPRSIDFLDELPKSAVGKILRRELREIEKAQ